MFVTFSKSKDSLLFASGSSDGQLIIWDQNLKKMSVLKPFAELILNESLLKLNITSITCLASLSEVCERVKLALNKLNNLILLFKALFDDLQWR